jgi:hypothetical protein
LSSGHVMETGANSVRGSDVRSQLTWSRVLLWATLFAVILFVPEDKSGCGFFRYGVMEFAHFAYTFAWMVIFFALRLRWRLLFLVVTVPVVLVFFGLHGIPDENAGPEAAAVAGLRQIQTSFETYRSQRQQGFPESLPSASLSPLVQKFYKYEYVPSRSASGEIVGYVVQATPRRRDCDFYLSFTITDDGKVFCTYQPRAATTGDQVLQ